MNRYLVTISYREPTYAKYARTPLHPYRATYEVTTESEQAAAALAVQEFRRTEAHSMVGWVRCVNRIECKPIGADVVCKIMGEEWR